jgi:hypothetical protein
MFHQTVNAASFAINCDPRPNPGVSSLTIRISFYLQCLFAIILALGQTSSRDIVLTNIMLQTSSLTAMAATYLNSDISHAIIASHFAIVMSMCRNTPLDFGREFLQSRTGLKTVTRIWLLDILFRPILLCFNYHLWSTVSEVQMKDTTCQSLGKWVLFGKSLEISMPGTSIPFTFVILDIGWEILRVVGEVLRFWRLRKIAKITIARQIGFDSRIWWVNQGYIKARRVFNKEMEVNGWDWGFICRGMTRISQLQKAVICGYVIWTTETMVALDGVAASEHDWASGQILAIANMLGMCSILAKRYLTFIPFRGMTLLRGANGRNIGFYCPFLSSYLFCRLFPRVSRIYWDTALLSDGVYQWKTGS